MIAYILLGVAFVWSIGSFAHWLKTGKKKRVIASRGDIKTRQRPLPKINYEKINYEKINNVTPRDKEMISVIGMRMMLTHGHQDLTGLLSDRANGVSLNDLMSKPYSLCGLPRNEKGRKI